MDMAAKTITFGFTFLKKAPLLLMRIPRLLAPFLLYVVVDILTPTVKRVYVNPLTAEISRHLTDMEHTDPSSSEYTRLLEETQHKARVLLFISIAFALVTLTPAFVFSKQIVARFFAASSTSNPGSTDSFRRYSLVVVLRELTRWRNLNSPLITTAAAITVLQIASVVLSGANFATVMRNFDVLLVQGLLFLAAFLYLCVRALMNVAARSVKREEFYVLVLVTLLLPTIMIPLCALAILYLYPKLIVALGLHQLSVYDLLQCVQHLLYIVAACVYFQWRC
jgi:hypothetical protein